MNKKKKALIAVVLILVLLAGGAGAWYFLGNKSSGNAVYIMPVSSFVDFGMGVANRFSGVVEAQQTVDYQLDTSKTLKETFVKEGDSVKIGDPLFSYDHAGLLIEEKGERTGVLEMRKHAAWYLKGVPNASKIRGKINEVTDIGMLRELLETF